MVVVPVGRICPFARELKKRGLCMRNTVLRRRLLQKMPFQDFRQADVNALLFAQPLRDASQECGRRFFWLIRHDYAPPSTVVSPSRDVSIPLEIRISERPEPRFSTRTCTAIRS